MRLSLFRTIAATGCLIIISGNISAQNFTFNCSRDTLVPGCPANLCIDLKAVIPDIHGLTSSYSINPASFNTACFQVYAAPDDPAGTASGLVIDDRYSTVINIGFPFPFFGTTYTDLVASTNGYISFDISLANAFSHYQDRGDLPNALYDRAIIMGPYHDLFPGQPTSPTQRIQYQLFGTAPNRRWVLSFYKVPLFQCTSLIENTHQIILFESTGIIEVKIFDKQVCASWQGGKTMVGIQDFTRTKGNTPPGRKMSDPPWGSIGMNETWRFVPDGGPSLLKRVELYDLLGNLISTGTTTALISGSLEASFPNICAPSGAVTSYVVRSVYEKIDDPAVEIFGTDTIRINRAAGLTGTASSTPASCGSADGTISVSGVTGGTLPYEYSLDGITWLSSNVFTNLPAGSYTVNIRDATTICTKDVNVTLGTIGNLAAGTASGASSCTGINDGTITVTSAAGAGPYTFVLDGGAPQTGTIPYTFTNIAAGPHTVLVTDIINGCISLPLNVVVAAGPGVIANATQSATSCPALANGSITVDATAGTAPFTFQLDAGTPQSGASPYVFTNVPSGPHTVIIRDNTGCTRTINITVNAGPTLSANALPAAASCSGAIDGTITVTPVNGTAPYTFSLDGAAFVPGTSPYTYSNLATGPHTIRVTDANGCITNVINVNIAPGPVLAASVVQSATSCSGAANGSITVTPTNGAAPYTFSLDGAAPVGGAAPYTFTNVAAGVHSIVIASAAGCVSNNIVLTVVAGPPLTTTVNKTDVLCNAGATGTITVTQPTIGNPPYQYSLDNINWQAGNIFNGLVAGTYTVYYRELNGCLGSQSITVTEPPVLSAIAAAVPVVCNGQSNGIVNITANGGVTPYEYSIDAGANWQSSNIFNVPAGTYTVITRDANGCTTPQMITVTEPAVLTAFSANTNASCNGGNDGTITVTAAGGNATYEYSIDNGANWQPANIFNVAPGSYTVLVRDNLGCTTNFPATVGLTNDLIFTPQTDPVICESKSTQLELLSNATQYAWTPRTGLNDTTIYNPVANPVVTTPYTVTATLGRCTATDIVVVNVNAAPIPDAGADGFICYGQSYTLQPSGGTVYAWAPTTYLNNPNSTNPVSTPVKDITYTMSIVSDVNGCASLVTDQIYIDVTPPVKVKTFPYDTIGYPGDRFQLLAVPSDTDANIYVWSPSAGLSNPNIANPIITIGPIGSDLTYQVITSTIAGCKGEGYVHIKVYTGPDIYMPTGFTPNGDGRNDRFTPFPVGIKSLGYFRVFNRWGQMVFSTNTLNVGWDGKFGGKDQASGTYVWMAEGVTLQGKKITKKGVVTLIR